MNESTVRVLQVRDGKAHVEIERPSACENCCAGDVCSSCETSSAIRLWVKDSIGLKAGESAVIGVPEGTVLKAGLLAYLLPVVSLLAGALLGSHWAPALGWSRDAGALSSGALALVVAIIVARAIAKRYVALPRVIRRA